MPKIVNRAVVISDEELNSMLKINEFFDLFFKMNKLVKSMSEKEFLMLEKSLEFTKEEMESNG